MRGCLRGCLGAVGLLVVVTGIAWAGWRWGPAVFPRLERALGVEESVGEAEGPEPSPGLAEETLDRFEAFRAGDSGERMTLGGAELSSVLRYALPGIVPPGVRDPSIELKDGEVVLRARVAVSAFPDLPSLDEVVGLLPDTVDIVMRGSLLPFGDDHAALHVVRVEAGPVPLPDRMTPGILRALGRTDREGLPRDALAIPLPAGLASAWVEEDQLVLVADR